MGSKSSSTTIINNNTTVIINAINAAALTNGNTFKTIPAGSDAAAVEKSLSLALLKTLEKAWDARFDASNPMQTGNIDQAFLLAPPTIDMNTPTTCAVTQITDDLNAWQVAAGNNVPSVIAQQILNGLVMESGLVSQSSGIKTLGPAQTVGWACATLTAEAGAGKSAESLIGYAFTAANVSQ